MQLSYPKEWGVSYAVVDSGTIINAGDFVWLDTDDVKPMSDFAWDTDLATTQAVSAAKFLGRALETSKSGEASEIAVQRSGECYAKMAAGTYEAGDSVGFDQSSGNSMLSDRLEAANAAESVFRVVQRGTVQDGGRLRVEIGSSYQPHNVNAQVG